VGVAEIRNKVATNLKQGLQKISKVDMNFRNVGLQSTYTTSQNKVGDKSFENVEVFKYFVTTLTNQN
jgi:hypothetical protein